MSQKMADLPETRLHKTPPFYHCGIDVFGHFNIRQCKETRQRSGTQKVWVLIFSCLYSRAIHLEVLDSMDTASFKQAFARFQALRGECVYLRIDAGSNFVGARNTDVELSEEVLTEVQADWQQQNKVWEFNPPRASHMGGVWERAIGQVRQVLQGYLLPKEQRILTREEFHTMLLHAASLSIQRPCLNLPSRPMTQNPSHLINS